MGAGLFCFKKGETKMTTDQVPKADVLFTEAPASWNTHYFTPEGFVCQLTLRADNGMDLLERANAALAFLLAHGYSPSDNNHNGKDRKWCPIHQCEMRRREKEGQVWYSHKLEDGGWCRGQQNKEGGNHE
jgi:hypothetical protein